MTRKDKIQLQYPDDLEAIDAELTEAMQHLDLTNERVIQLLRSCEPPKPETAATPSDGPQHESAEGATPNPEAGQNAG